MRRKYPFSLDRYLVEEGHRKFSQDSPELKFKRIRESEQHPLIFGRHYLPHYLNKKSAHFHKEILDLAMINEDMAIAAPRGHAKSTNISLLYPLWCTCFRKKRFIVIISDTATQANEFLDAVRIELEENQKITDDFGCLIGKRKWTGSDFVTAHGVKVIAKGTGSQTRGLRYRQLRPDLTLVDDPENDEMVMSGEQRNKTFNWLTRNLSNCLDPNTGQLIVLGTLIHGDCLLAKLLKNPAFIRRIYRAIDKNGNALWPDMWPLEKLEKKKNQIGSLAFNTEFMNNPLDPDSMIFNPDWFKYYEPSNIEGIPMDIFMAVDPSLGRKERGDYSAIITIGINREDMRIYVLDADISRITPRKLIDKIANKFFAFTPIRIAIESVAFQEVLKEWLDELSREKGWYLPTMELQHRSDKVMRISRLSPLFERGEIFLRRDQTRLLEQLEFFPKGDHDDGPDALEMAVDIARRLAMQFEIIQEPVEEGVFYI